MKVYCVTVYDTDLGQRLAWFSNRREAETYFKSEQTEPPQGPCGVKLMDIPTSRNGLLAWLNTHFSSNNG